MDAWMGGVREINNEKGRKNERRKEVWQSLGVGVAGKTYHTTHTLHASQCEYISFPTQFCQQMLDSAIIVHSFVEKV